MNGIVGMIEVVEVHKLDEETRSQLDTVRLSANSLLGIINDILDFSAIEAGRLNVGSSPVDIESEIISVCSMLGQVAQQRGVHLSSIVDPSIPKTLLGDSLRIRQIITNLAGNALKFSSDMQREGRVCIEAVLENRSETAVDLVIRISDNGIGIREEDQERLFQPFEQVKHSTGTSMGGTGLGLAISRELASVMGGSIALHSVFGEGTEFVFRLPLEIDPGGVQHVESLRGVQVTSCFERSEENVHFSNYLVAEGAEFVTQNNKTDPSKQQIGIVFPAPFDAQAKRLKALQDEHPELPILVIGRQSDAVNADDFAGASWIAGSYLTRTQLAESVRLHLDSNKSTANNRLVANPAPEKFVDQKPILVAEDNLINQTVIRSQLKLLGFEAVLASDGAEAFDLWKNGEFDVLLTDIQMPLMDGFQLAKKVRMSEEEIEGPRLSILALSADVQKEQIRAALDCGMDGYITKPVSLDELRDRLGQFLD